MFLFKYFERKLFGVEKHLKNLACIILKLYILKIKPNLSVEKSQWFDGNLSLKKADKATNFLYVNSLLCKKALFKF